MLTDEQKKLRKEGITGTDIGAVCGLNPYRSRFDVFTDKVEKDTVAAEPSHHLERGTYLEDGIIRWYQNRYKVEKVDRPGTLRHPKQALVLATPDGITSQERILEVKCPGAFTAKDWGEDGDQDGVPEYYLPQVTWEMAVASLPKADVVAFIDGDIRRYTVPYDEQLFELLAYEAEKFWHDHVLTGRPPEADGTAACSRWLDTHIKQHKSARLMQADGYMRQVMTDYVKIRQQREELEEQERLKKNILKQLIGENDGVEDELMGKIYWRSPKPSVKTDWKAIAQELGANEETIARYTQEVPMGRRFNPVYYFAKKDK